MDLSEFVFRSAKDGYDLFLGRLHSIKGYPRQCMMPTAGKWLVVAGASAPVSIETLLRQFGGGTAHSSALRL